MYVPNSAVIFDFDGTLVNTEEIYFQCDKDFCALYGIDFDDEMRHRMVGIGSVRMIELMMEEYGIDRPLDKLMVEKDDIFLQLVRQGVEVFPEMLELVHRLQQDGYPLGLASGSPTKIINEVIDLCGLGSYFHTIVSTDQVNADKPDPAVYLEAAHRLDCPAEKCVAIEDSQYGVLSALAAGMSCVVVPTLPDPPLPPGILKADLLIEGGMARFKAEEVYRWIDRRLNGR